MVILATNMDQLTTAIGTCLCVAKSDAGGFTIPAALLANVPESRNLGGVPPDQFYLSSMGAGLPLPITGLERSALFSLYTIGRFVEYR